MIYMCLGTGSRSAPCVVAGIEPLLPM